MLLLRRNSVQGLFNGYYFDYQLAALSPSSGFIDVGEVAYQASGAKVPKPIAQKQQKMARSECPSPKNELVESPDPHR